MNKVLPSIFDSRFYYENNPDIKTNYVSYNEEEMKTHYINDGQFKNKKYCDISDNFNWEDYIDFVNYNPSHYGNKYLKNKNDAIESYIKYGKVKLIEQNIHDIFFKSSDVDCTNTSDNKDIFFVYYCYLNPSKNWRHIVYGQLIDIYNSQILTRSKLFIVVCGNQNDIDEAKIYISEFIKTDVYFYEFTENNYEFNAIKILKGLADDNRDKTFIYMHSKGMVNHNPSDFRTFLEIKLTKNTILNWEDTLYQFKKNKLINKAGLLPSDSGFVWFNFWWARGSYIADIKKLDETDNRFNCESWIGFYGTKSWIDTYSLIYKNISFVTIHDTVTVLFDNTA